MYKNGYVLAILANGNPVDESPERTIQLPFGTEYKVRMINKNNKRCAADLVVNGEQIARFIVGSGETLDVERFLDGNLNSGKRFKFTHLNDPAVKSKKDIDNGLVEVFFYEEKELKPIVIREEHHHHHWDHYPLKPQAPYVPWMDPWNSGYKECDNFVSLNYCSTGGKGMSACTDGATVRGSESKQEFQKVSGYEFNPVPIALKIKIINGEIAIASKYCASCGRKRRHGDSFCSNCGNKY